MKLNTLVVAIAVVSLTTTAVSQAGTVTTDGQDLVLQTKGGFKISTDDKQYSFKLGGRLQYDYNRSEFNGNADEDQFDLRRARLFVSGDIQDWSYKTQFNIGGSKGGSAEDLYIRYNGFGKKAKVTIGRQKIPFGLEELTSSKDISMLERSAITERFAIGRADGVQVSGKEGDFTYAVSAFEEAGGVGNDDDFGIATRVTFAPIKTDNTVVHVGLAYKNVSAGMSAFGLELAGALGSLHAQAEYVDADEGTTDANGYYMQAGWIITGEQRAYKNGVFKRVKPQSNSGAVEVVLRYESGDGDYGDVELGTTDASAWGLGVNWYVNNNVKFGLNYTDGDDHDSSNDGDEFRARVQLVF